MERSFRAVTRGVKADRDREGDPVPSPRHKTNDGWDRVPRHVDRMDGIDRADIGQDRTFPAIPVPVTSYRLLDVTPDPLRYVIQETLPIGRSFSACVTAVHVSELDRFASSVSGTSLSPSGRYREPTVRPYCGDSYTPIR